MPLFIYAGPIPEVCDAPTTGEKLAEYELPQRWWGYKVQIVPKFSDWDGFRKVFRDGNTCYFRVFGEDGVCHIQGTVTQRGDGGDIEVDRLGPMSIRIVPGSV